MAPQSSVFLLAVTLACLLPSFAHSIKIDCYPIAGVDKESCESKGCVWSPVNETTSSAESSTYGQRLPFNSEAAGVKAAQSTVREPWCYFPDTYVGYRMVNSSYGPHKSLWQRRQRSALPDDIMDIVVELAEETPSALRFKIYAANSRRYEPELPVMRLAGPQFIRKTAKMLHFELGEDRLIIKRASTGAILFEADISKLIFADKFIQLDSKLSSPFVYGLGEHYSTFLKYADKYQAFSFYHTDKLPLPVGQRSYGGFPFYINLDSDNQENAHGLYLRNSNGMDIVLKSDQSISFRPIGGILDFTLFIGPTPNDVISQFQRAVGLPDLPPRWALGFHLCRYNYNTLDKTRLVWERTRNAKIPFDCQWNDIDYMDKHNDFTYDHDKFNGLPEFVEELHKNDMRYMILFDPGLSQEKGYRPYQLGEQMEVYIRNSTNQTLVGKVWNDSGRTVFPDFSNPKSVDFWSKLFVEFQETLKFDGAWIDMNDISNFVDGSLDGCPTDNHLERPPYKPGGFELQSHSLCLSAKHRAGPEYDVHNLYSFYEAIATSKALQAARPNRRSLIISRSTAPGQGHYGGHWSGDVLSNWDYLKWSIPSLLEHTMYGFSMMGSDICGFLGNTNPQLCARWSTLGAFYSFSRNHNDDVSIDQDPVALGPEVVEANRNALTKKYSLIPYMYSLIYRAHLYGEPAIRSIPFEFYRTDPEALKVEYQFMWGEGLMVSPIVDQDTFSKSSYLPKGRWYETDVLPSKGNKTKVPKLIDSKGEWHESKEVSLSDIPLFYRGGHIIPIYSKVEQTIAATAKQPIGLEVSLCPMSRSHGELIIDDGESSDEKYNMAKMSFENGKLIVQLDLDNYKPTLDFGQVRVYGYLAKVDAIKVNNQTSIPFTKTGHVVMFDLTGFTVSKERSLIAEFV